MPNTELLEIIIHSFHMIFEGLLCGSIRKSFDDVKNTKIHQLQIKHFKFSIFQIVYRSNGMCFEDKFLLLCATTDHQFEFTLTSEWSNL